MTTYLITFLAVGLLYIAVGIPLWRRSIPRNQWYGLRCPDSLSSDEVWYESNAACGRQFVWLGAALMVVAGALTVFEWRTPDDYALAMCGVLVFSTVVLAFWGLATAREIRKRVEGKR